MRLALDPRARQFLRRIPHMTVYSAIELSLLFILAIQCARFFWVAVTPVDAVGEWKAGDALRPASASQTDLIGGFDPFFRTGGDTPVMTTSLNLKLFGIREDRSTARGGAAIIALPDGQQYSFAVGDQVVPGVVLAAVMFDSVSLTRSGVAEQLFLEQFGQTASGSPENASPNAPTVNFAPGSASAPAAASAPPVRYQPRMDGTQVTGITVQPSGDGAAFRASGLVAGDVIVSVDGQRITSAEQAQALGSRLADGGVRVEVERGGRTIPLRVGDR